MDVSIAHDRVAGKDDGDAGAADSDEALFAGVRGHAEAMIAWAGSAEALALDNGQLESRAMRDGLEFMRLLTQAHLDLRAARQRIPATMSPTRTGMRARAARTGTSGPG